MENHRQLSAEAISRFEEGISLVLSRWSALQLAVDNEFGGRDSRLKSQQLPLELLSLLTQSKEPVYIDDVENLLDDFMLTLNTEISDGSIEEISEKLMVMHEECLEGNFTSIQKLKESNLLPRATVPHVKQDDESEDDSSSRDDEDSSSDMAVDVAQESQSNLKPMDKDKPSSGATTKDEDGWTTVPSRRNRATRK